MRKSVLQDSGSLNRRAFLWNTAGSLLYSGMSSLLLFVTVRLCGPSVSGVFSIAFTSSQMMQSIGLYGIRNYQATDVKGQYIYPEYLTSRLWTTVAMLFVSVLYGVLMGYRGQKLTVMLLFCLAKTIEAFSDVFEGLLQQRARLDLAAKGVFWRSFFMMAVFSVVLLVSRDLVAASVSLVAGAVIGSAAFPFRDSLSLEKPRFARLQSRKVFELLAQCTPLFLSAALLILLNSMPKVSIDRYLGNEAQTYFNIVFMPAFLINLLSGFLFRPLLNQLAEDYAQERYPAIKKLVKRLLALIMGIGIAGVILAYLVGIPVLAWVFGVDLTGYQMVLVGVVIGGIFCALVNFLGSILTVMRRQHPILLGYGIAAVIMLGSSGILTRHMGVGGAAIAYLISMGILCVILWMFYIDTMGKKCENKKMEDAEQ